MHLHKVCTWAKCDEYARVIFKHFAKARAAMKPADFVELLQLWIWTPAYMQANAADLLQSQLSATTAAKSGNDSAWMPLAAFEAQCEACIFHDTTSEVNNIKVPTLLTVGMHDIFTPMRFSEYLHQRIEGSKLKVFSGGGHVHHWEALEEFNQATTHWLLEN